MAARRAHWMRIMSLLLSPALSYKSNTHLAEENLVGRSKCSKGKAGAKGSKVSEARASDLDLPHLPPVHNITPPADVFLQGSLPFNFTASLITSHYLLSHLSSSSLPFILSSKTRSYSQASHPQVHSSHRYRWDLRP